MSLSTASQPANTSTTLVRHLMSLWTRSSRFVK